MPVLPVDYPEPFVAVLGTMLYPNEGEDAQRRAVTAHYLAEPIRRFEALGGVLPYDDLLRIVKTGGARLDDLDQAMAGRDCDGRVVQSPFRVGKS
jgi:hypothetical protein